MIQRLQRAGRVVEAQGLAEAFNLKDAIKRNHLDPLVAKDEFGHVDPQEIAQSLSETQRFIPAATEVDGVDLTVPRDKFAPPTFPPRQGGGPSIPGNQRGVIEKSRGVFPGMPKQSFDAAAEAASHGVKHPRPKTPERR